MSKLTFTEFVKYAQAYEAYAAQPETAPASQPETAPASQPETAPASQPETAPASQPDLSSIEESLAHIMNKLNEAPNPSMAEVKPVGIDDIMKKIFN